MEWGAVAAVRRGAWAGTTPVGSSPKILNITTGERRGAGQGRRGVLEWREGAGKERRQAGKGREGAEKGKGGIEKGREGAGKEREHPRMERELCPSCRGYKNICPH